MARVRRCPAIERGRSVLRDPAADPPAAGTDPWRRRRLELDLTVAAGQTELLPGTSTATWGINGSYLAPTLRATRGDDVTVRFTNDLDEATTLHWHGMHLPAAADGGPHQVVEPGATWRAEWQVDQPAATLWYHAHPEGRTGEQVYRGVAGMFLLDDATTDDTALPHTYGVDDIPLIVQDKRFDDDGQLDLDSPRFSPVGILGDTIAVNGTIDPYLPVTTRLVRLRVLNASRGRAYNLGFTDNRPFAVIAGHAGTSPSLSSFAACSSRPANGSSSSSSSTPATPSCSAATPPASAAAAPTWTDAQTPYMFHCHVLAHEDHGMMGQYTVE